MPRKNGWPDASGCIGEDYQMRRALGALDKRQLSRKRLAMHRDGSGACVAVECAERQRNNSIALVNIVEQGARGIRVPARQRE